MDRPTFNRQIETDLWPILQSAGFDRLGKDFGWEHRHRQMVLLRFDGDSDKTPRAYAKFILGLRHLFLKPCFDHRPVALVYNGNDYPFRLRPTFLGTTPPRAWHYVWVMPEDRFDVIAYGRQEDCRPQLRDLGRLVASQGIEWALHLTPARALRHLERFGSGYPCEKQWIADYRCWLDSTASTVPKER